MQQLNWQYPTWYLLFCLLAGIAAAVFLYRRDSTFQDQAPGWRILMAVLRGLAVTVISSLLLAPLLRFLQTRTEQPIIILAHDLSTSVSGAFQASDSAAYQAELTALEDQLSERFTVHRVGFGEEVNTPESWVWDDQASDMGAAMAYIREQYRGQPVGAVILASDGAVNRGRNPLYEPLQQKAPLHVIAIGDTTRKTDLQVRDVFHNSIAYLNDRFSVQMDVAALRLAGSTARLEVLHVTGNQPVLLQSIPLSISEDPWFATQEVIIEASRTGIQRYRVQVSRLPGEVSFANNSRDFFVEVIDGRLKVLVLANSPHPDLAVWRSALQQQRNYEVDIRMVRDFALSELPGYDLAVLHQLPSDGYPGDQLLSELSRLRIPRVFVLGAQTSLPAFNRAQSLLVLQGGGDRTPNEVTALLNPGFTAFKVPEALRTRLGQFTPMLAPYGDYEAAPAAQVLAFQRIGQVDTQFPLILMAEEQEMRTVVVAGEGVWRWQLFEQLQYATRENTYELLSQLCQYASTKSDKRKFTVSLARKIYSEIEDIQFQAELYNDNYELINTPEVNMRIRNEAGEDFDFVFTPSGEAYALRIGRFPEGNYTFVATTELNGVDHRYEGRFIVQPVQLETLTSAADHGLLRELAARHQGEVFRPGQLSALADRILTNENIKPVVYSTTQTRPLIHLKWLCLALIGILGIEWFLRRYFGGY